MHRLLLAALLAVPASAHAGAAWDSYFNARYGYEVAVPPGFAGQGEPDAGDGQVFRSADRNVVLTVWGGYLDGSFKDDVDMRLGGFRTSGWNITYQAETPGWAAYSGTRGQRVFYSREIAGCKGTQLAAFELDYPATQIKAMNAVVSKLAASLKQRACS